MKRAILVNGYSDDEYNPIEDLGVSVDPETKKFDDLLQLFDSHYKSKMAVFVKKLNL